MNAITQAPLQPITAFKNEHAFLSNFYMAPVTGPDKIVYPSAEHAFQAYKTVLRPMRQRIADLPTARDAKAAGRHVVLRPDWEQIKKQVMLRVVMAKFIQHPDLAAQLAATGDRPLVEGNMWHDHIWGHCYCQGRRCQGEGRNYLGQILMAARLVLRED